MSKKINKQILALVFHTLKNESNVLIDSKRKNSKKNLVILSILLAHS